MLFDLSALSLTYPLLLGVILGLAWLFKLQSRIEVLESELKITKEYQAITNEGLRKVVENIDVKLDNVLQMLANGKNNKQY